MFLSALATLNFSLAFIVGLLASPLSFIPAAPSSAALRWACIGLLHVVAPTTVWYTTASLRGLDLQSLLVESALGWDVSGVYIPIVIWCVWWPAWLVGSAIVLVKPSGGTSS